MHARLGHSTSLYALERIDVGIVQLDRELRVVAMNALARRVLPVEEKQPFDKVVLSFHPERSRAKVQFLLDQSECPVNNPPPMAMIINIPERVLLIKVSRMADLEGQTIGYTLIFHDVTDAVAADDGGAAPARGKRILQKIPTVAQSRIRLVDVDEVCFIRADGHYTWINTAEGAGFCNLSITDLEARLDPNVFMRVHRRYLANLRCAEQIQRQNGKVQLKLRGGSGSLPVSRGSVPQLLDRLGLGGADAER
jgi:LytTR family transcriptional regulator, CO-responsive transcriptional regulator RcoM